MAKRQWGNNSNYANIEGLKEALRLIVLYIVSFLLTENVLTSLLIVMFGTKLTTQETFLIITALTIILKGIDKAIHKKGKKLGNAFLLRGLTQF